MIEVSCGLILNNQHEALMTLRFSDRLCPSMWEMPGGKREPNETGPECLARELREELGVIVTVRPRVLAVATFEWDDQKNPGEFVFVQCTLYHAIITAGQPQPLDAAALAYYDLTYARRHRPLCPSAYMFYPHAVRYINRLKQGLPF